jgi:hypothetical protein
MDYKNIKYGVQKFDSQYSKVPGVTKQDMYDSFNSYRMPNGIYVPDYNPYQLTIENTLMPVNAYDMGEEMDNDIEYVKYMYPKAAKEILKQVEEECDKLEYEGSVMFDEYPDKTNLGRIVNNIYDRVKHLDVVEGKEVETEQYCMGGNCIPNYCVDCYNDGRPNWLRQLIETLFYQELINRRRRYRRRRRWY